MTFETFLSCLTGASVEKDGLKRPLSLVIDTLHSKSRGDSMRQTRHHRHPFYRQEHLIESHKQRLIKSKGLERVLGSVDSRFHSLDIGHTEHCLRSMGSEDWQRGGEDDNEKMAGARGGIA